MEKSKILYRRIRTCLMMIMFFCHIILAANAAFTSDIKTIPYNKGFTSLFGEDNIKTSSTEENRVALHLNQYTGTY